MFELTKPIHLTDGVEREIPPVIIAKMVESIQRLKSIQPIQHFQFFDIQQKDNITVIEHQQEDPPYKKEMVLTKTYNQYNGKVYAVDNGGYITILLWDEY